MAYNVRATSVAGMFLSTCITLGIIGSPFFTFVALKSVDLREIGAEDGNASSPANPSFSEAEEQAPAPGTASIQLDRQGKETASPQGEGIAAPEDDRTRSTQLVRVAKHRNLKPWYKDAESRPFLMLTRSAVLSAAALFGALGATLSVLTRTSTVPIRTQQLVGLQLVGATFALILALIFAGGFIQGSLFPEGIYGSWFGVVYVHKEFAKLLVWSFIAGFSERTIPEILRKFTERLSGEVEDEKRKSKEEN